ncbi:hypothetical protein ACNF5D_27100, partial [Escherichia coli]
QAATAGTAVAGLELELQSGHGAVIRANSCPLSPKTGPAAHSGLNGTAVEPRHAWLCHRSRATPCVALLYLEKHDGRRRSAEEAALALPP